MISFISNKPASAHSEGRSGAQSNAHSSAKRQLKIYLGVTIFCAIFSFVYELFSHGVYSPFMVGMAAIPLTLGVLPNALALKFPKINVGSWWQKAAHAFAVATLTIGSCLQGILEIYGTTNELVWGYLIVGGVLLLISFVLWAKDFDE